MKPKDIGLLLLLSALWGGSFLFIRIAVPVFGPFALMETRVLVAGIALVFYVGLLRKIDLQLAIYWRQYLIIGIVNTAIPFTLIAAAEQNLTAGFAAILNATSPLFGALIAALWIKEPLTLSKVTGLILGLVGVGIVVGWSPFTLSLILVLSIGASFSAAAFYGIGSVYTKVSTHDVSPMALATCTQLGAALFLAPFAAFTLPTTFPDMPIVLAVLSLAIFCTSLGYLIYYHLIKNIGPTRTLTVTFMAPVFGVIWGSLFLDEQISLSSVIGFGIVLIGTGFVTGIIKRKKKPVLVSIESVDSVV